MIQKIFNILSLLIMIIILICIAVASPIVVGLRPVVVLSGSMIPAYPVGSITYYHPAEFSEIEEGDAITFTGGESLVTHRVVEKNNVSEDFITKGDNNETVDINSVGVAQLKGKTVKLAIPFVGYLVCFIKQLPVFLTMASILIVSHLLDRAKEKK